MRISITSPASLLARCSTGQLWLIGMLSAALIAGFFPTGRVILATGFWLMVTGYLLERRMPGERPHWLLRIAIWNGLGLSLVPLLYLWVTALGSAIPVWLLICVGILLAVVALYDAWRDLAPVQVHPSVTVWLLLSVLAISAWLRAMQIADLVFPAWVDSVHHALMVRVAAETGRVPWTLTPYLPVTEMPYHWGYHVLIAAAWHLGGSDLLAMMLWSGQLLNWVQGLSAAALAFLVWRRPLAAVIAAAIVGCISWMPAYYVSWGRYTQLSGLLQIVALAIGWQQWLDANTRRERLGWLFLNMLIITGLSLVHMRMFVFGGALIAVQFTVWASHQARPAIVSRMVEAMGTGMVALILAGPWWLVLARRILLPAATGAHSLTSGGSYVQLSDSLMWIGPNEWLVALALFGGAIGVLYRQRAATVIVLWVGLLVVLSNPWLISYLAPPVGLVLILYAVVQRTWFAGGVGMLLLAVNPLTVRLPFLWLLPVDITAISLFLPLSNLIGGSVALIWPRPRWSQMAAIAVLLGCTLWGAYQQRTIVNPVTVLATAADRVALEWIAEQTPPTARFLINAAPWLPGVARGTDGGWWILPLTGRWTSTPPVLFVHGEAEYVQATQQRSQRIIDFGNGQAVDIASLIAAERIDYIYTSPKGPLRPEQFAGQPGYEAAFAHDGIVIYRVIR
ncbi:hypothetical protein [Chloroflexus sp.]|uniref:hypothetical protein n=1 Tax=Chloroflexus sp. TaxID=1904827 RepID=UPI002ADDC9CC|nr:hypothetical protein [Chloroflexus sp.]